MRVGARVGVGVRVRVRIRVRVSVAMAHGVLVAVEDGGDTKRYREIQGRYRGDIPRAGGSRGWRSACRASAAPGARR